MPFGGARMKLPKGWNIAALEEVSEIQTGLSKSESREGPFVRMPYLRVANVQDGHFDLSEIKEIYVPEGMVERFRVREGDVLLTEGGDFDKLGRGAVWEGQIKDCVHQNHIFVVRPQIRKLNTRFFAYQTQGPHGRAYFQSCSKQSTNLASINSTQLRQFPALLPPLPEQRKIAEILGTWDDGLEKLDTLIAAKERRKNGLMQQLLTGKRRVKGAAGRIKTLKSSEIFANRSERNVNRLPALSVTQDQGVLLRSDLDRRIMHDADNTPSYKVAHAGDFIISLRSFQGGLEYTSITGAVSPAYHVIHPIIEVDRSFYRHYFKSPVFIGRLATAVIGIRDGKQVSLDDFKFLRLPYPDLPMQKYVGEILDACDDELRLLRAQRAAIDRQKRGLMQRLLTGRVRTRNHKDKQGQTRTETARTDKDRHGRTRTDGSRSLSVLVCPCRSVWTHRGNGERK